MAKARYAVSVSLNEEENTKLELLKTKGIMPKIIFRRGLDEIVKENVDKE
jgi:hypothetical protein